ncbi:MAG: UDP-N-acetyl-D-glucosamine dehydrogenase [Desulfobulbaceae bacterium A2]|nr:MAG: UDP-N-acetyl-D-glucosamine dehydrogenase [Desulfobulbaceae bacterium A2]
MQHKVRIGVIGVGYLGKIHAKKYAAMEGVELVGVADVNLEQARAVAGACATRAFADYRELLPLVDGVSVVVPTTAHCEVARICLEQGVDILLEKPITVTLEEADHLIALAEQRGRILQVGLLERFNPAVLALQPLLTHPLFIEAHRISTFKDRGVDVNVVLDLMIHDLDIILSIVKAPLESIHAVGAPVVTATTDIANARLVFANGCVANVTASRISLDNVRRMRIFQPGGYLTVDFVRKEIMSAHLPQRTGREVPQPVIDRRCFLEQDTLELELADFLGSIRERRSPVVSGVDGRRALEVALQVEAQIQRNLGKVQDLLKIDRLSLPLLVN